MTENWQNAATWKSEIEHSRALAQSYWQGWQDNLDFYTGKSSDAAYVNKSGGEFININADFTNVEVKGSQLFFEQPELQLTAKGAFQTPPPAAPMPGQPPQPQLDGPSIIASHRELLSELLGSDHADALTTVQKAIKDCLATAGVGATKICYEAAMETIQTPPELAMLLPDAGHTLDRPVDEQWKWERIPSKKFRIPADFKDTDFDKAPWLAMEFRMPLAQGQRLFNLPSDFEGTSARDDKRLDEGHTSASHDESGLRYLEGTEIWYYAHMFDKHVVNPRAIRRHVVVEGVEGFVEKKIGENPYQTLLPNGRLSTDSMIGFPIHVLAIRNVPDSAFVPSDETMTRPLVRELCRFRTQQVLEREANILRFGYDVAQVPPETVKRIEEGTIGIMIPFPAGAMAVGMDKLIQQISKGSQSRDSYTANDYVQRDLDKTLGIDAMGSGVQGNSRATATEINVVDRVRSVRLDGEQRQVLSWYLKGVQKFSALVCRYMTPELAVPYIGEAQAQTWATWDKKTWDGRMVFKARPDSQLKLDGAAERKYYLDLYQFLAKDPNINRVELLRELVQRANLDPTKLIVTQLPPKPDIPNLGFTFKGEDLLGPQAQQVREILAQGGITISQEAIDASASQLFQQMQMGIRDASGQMVKATPNREHGGTTEKVRPLNQQSADLSGQRSGPKTQGEAA